MAVSKLKAGTRRILARVSHLKGKPQTHQGRKRRADEIRKARAIGGRGNARLTHEHQHFNMRGIGEQLKPEKKYKVKRFYQ